MPLRPLPISATALRAALLAFLAALASPARAAWLRLSRPEAALELRAEEAQVRQAAAQSSVRRKDRFFQERLRLDAQGNLYDERFAAFSLGLGLNLAQSRAEGPVSRGGRSLDDEYQAQLFVLPKHDLSGSASAERGRSTTHNVFAGQTRLERTHLRASLGLKRTRMPMSLSLWDSRLSGPGTVQPFEQTSQGLQWLASLKPAGNFSATLRQNLERFHEAQSGGYEYKSTGALLEAAWAERHRLRAQGRVEQRDGKLLMRLAGGEGGWEFAGRALRAGSRYGFEEKRVEAQRTQRHSLFAHAEHRLFESLTSSLAGDLEFNREALSRSETRKVMAQEDYVKRIWGPIRFNAHLDQSLRWSESRFDVLLDAALNEPLELKDGAPSFLAQLVPDPATVLIFSADRLRRYREGQDYELVAHGTLLEVRRVVTGNIRDGEKLLVSYQHAVSGRRRTRDAARGLRFSLLLGSRGSLWVSENRQSQDFASASLAGLAPNVESFRERGWGWDLRWRLFSTSQSWRERASSIAPLRSFRSALRAGGPVHPRLSVLLGWTYDSSRFPASGTASLGRGYSLETVWTPAPKLELGAEARMGRTSASGLDGRYRSLGARLSWNFRSVEAELSDRFTWRSVGGSLSQENLVQARALRRL